MDLPAANLARRLLRKKGLKPPIDVQALVKSYADLVFRPIPIAGIDGISMHLKALDRRPKVVVNSMNAPRRIRFTLAHELGHILIPWHVGAIADSIDLEQSLDDSHWQAEVEGWGLEREANSFAAELLMPYEWINDLLQDIDNLAAIHKRIITECESSPIAGALRLAGLLPPNVTFASENEGRVEYSGRSEGTFAGALPWGAEFPESPYGYADHHYSRSFEGRVLHWWRLPRTIDIDPEDQRPWRDILKDILSDLALGVEGERKMQQSINGVAAYAHSAAKRQPGYSRETVMAACLQKFRDRSEYKDLVKHKLFDSFVRQRAEAFFSSKSL